MVAAVLKKAKHRALPSCGRILPSCKCLIKAGVYQPSLGSYNLLEPNCAGMNNTIGRAETADITAAVTHNHIYIATDSLISLHKVGKQLLYEGKHHLHVQGDTLNFFLILS